jgi:nucleoside-triphosphatase
VTAAGPVRVIVTGEVGCGKTQACATVAARLQDRAWQVAGVISPGVWKGDQKVGISALDLRSGEVRRLAERARAGHDVQGPATPGWRFFPETIAWCNSLLLTAVDCDLLVVDELGPLEFECGEGLIEGMRALGDGRFLLALVVIRPRLLQAARQRWPRALVINLRGATEVPAEAKWLVELAGTLKPSVGGAPAPQD